MPKWDPFDSFFGCAVVCRSHGPSRPCVQAVVQPGGPAACALDAALTEAADPDRRRGAPSDLLALPAIFIPAWAGKPKGRVDRTWDMRELRAGAAAMRFAPRRFPPRRPPIGKPSVRVESPIAGARSQPRAPPLRKGILRLHSGLGSSPAASPAARPAGPGCRGRQAGLPEWRAGGCSRPTDQLARWRSVFGKALALDQTMRYGTYQSNIVASIATSPVNESGEKND